MMRVRVYVGALLVVAWSGALVVAQTKVTTPEQLDKVMKSVGPAMRNMQKALKSDAFADARKELATMRAGVLDSQSFWVEHKKEDAVKMNKESIAKHDAHHKLLSGPADAATAGWAAALKEVGGSCSACHKQYRAQDAENNYVLKPGSVGG
jgi:cytochrome c556